MSFCLTQGSFRKNKTRARESEKKLFVKYLLKMANRQNNQLPHNLPQLQNLIKRDPESYKEEFLQQFRHFESTLQVFELNPNEINKSLDDQVMFLAQVSKCYPEELKDFPQKLISILNRHSTVLHAEMRMSLCKSLILIRLVV